MHTSPAYFTARTCVRCLALSPPRSAEFHASHTAPFLSISCFLLLPLETMPSLGGPHSYSGESGRRFHCCSGGSDQCLHSCSTGFSRRLPSCPIVSGLVSGFQIPSWLLVTGHSSPFLSTKFSSTIRCSFKAILLFSATKGDSRNSLCAAFICNTFSSRVRFTFPQSTRINSSNCSSSHFHGSSSSSSPRMTQLVFLFINSLRRVSR
ncbi:hypothetical protein GOODEAATRI_009393 [Goodea atripinnis]|uniref:Uncharacterized protein n=1 Tax=Goodea atripinnis TaxID=208336 RepID=A0ABV0MR79_9TELE